jgi:hypothetical protein
MGSLSTHYWISAVIAGFVCLILTASAIRQKTFHSWILPILMLVSMIDKIASLIVISHIIQTEIVYQPGDILWLKIKETAYQASWLLFLAYLVESPKTIIRNLAVWLDRKTKGWE